MGAAPILEAIHRHERGRILAALMAELRDLDLAEEALSEAMESALVHWGRAGVPDRPGAWLLTAARRKVIDRWRRAARLAARAPDLRLLAEADAAAREEPAPEIPDERLRLIFTCCHPALEAKTRVALTLRTLGGLTTAEIARAFLDTEPAMGQRLSRAKAKIREAGIPFAVPGPGDWAARLGSVLAVLYLIFNEGYAVTAGAAPLRVDLSAEAIYLARMLDQLRPDEPEVLGLLALMLITDARRAARLGPDGALVALDRQDRRLWDQAGIAEGEALVDRAMALRAPGPFQIKAAIAALHTAPAIDRRQIFLLYDSLLRFEPTPVVRLNRAVALAETGEAAAALALVEALRVDLHSYQPFHAALAELRARAGQGAGAAEAYGEAIARSGNAAERAFLRTRLAAVQTAADPKKKAEQSSAQVQQGGKDTEGTPVSHEPR